MEAVGHFVTWHMEAHGDLPEGVQVRRCSRWQLALALASLRVVEVARWTADDGWHIVDPEMVPCPPTT